ncbi:MAG: flippase [Thermodesulfobacteriota bacterium]|nr:flippase [Thermodesulfobacteriota bacterium]
MQEVLNGASIAFTLKVIGAGLSFSFNVVLARILGAEGAGIYYLALTITMIATVFGRMGLDNTLLRFIASNAAIGDWVAVKGVYRKGMVFALTASGLSSLIMFSGAPFLALGVFSKPELTDPMRWMSLAIIPITLLMLHAEALKGLKRIRDSQLVQGVWVPALSLLMLYVLCKILGVTGAVLAYVFAAIITVLIGYASWRRATPQLKGITWSFKTHDLMKTSVPLFFVTLMHIVINWTASFALGVYGSNADVGIFNIACRTAMLTSFVLIAVNSIAAPKFAALYGQGDMEALGYTARNSAKLMTLMAGPVLLFFALFPEWVMGLFGSQFKDGSSVLLILSLGQFINVATGSVGYLLMMSGYERLLRNSITCVAIGNIVMNVLLIQWFGIIGAAVATALSLAAMNLIFMVFVWRRLKIWTLPFMPGFSKAGH